jgi:hypothetical protein
MPVISTTGLVTGDARTDLLGVSVRPSSRARGGIRKFFLFAAAMRRLRRAARAAHGTPGC